MKGIYVLIAVLAFSVVLGSSPVYADLQGDVDQQPQLLNASRPCLRKRFRRPCSKMPEGWLS